MFYFSSNFNTPFMSTQPPPPREEREEEQSQGEEEEEVQASQAFSMNTELGLLEKRKNGLKEQLKENERQEKNFMETFELIARKIATCGYMPARKKAYWTNVALEEANRDNFMFLSKWVEDKSGTVDCRMNQFGIIKYLTADEGIAKFIVYDNALGKAYLADFKVLEENDDIMDALYDHNNGISDNDDDDDDN